MSHRSRMVRGRGSAPWWTRLGATGVLIAAALAPASVAAAEPSVTFGTPTASSSFGTGVDFVQPVTISSPIRRVEILVATPGAVGPVVQEVPGGTQPGSTTLRYHLDLADGNTAPNTPFTARWRLVGTDGASVTGPAVRHLYADDRFDWKSIDGRVVRVHWVSGDDAFGRRALTIGEDAVAKTSSLLGVTESEPIDFFVYADQQAFYDALGPATRENVGGQAHPDIRTLFALITPGEIDASWVSVVVPHELTHVVFQTAIDNPYREPPRWLNEGLAVYLSAGYQDSDRRQVTAAARDGTIIPLDGLTGAFPTTRERFFLAYAESVSAVDRIVRANGRDALVRLIRSYATGVADDDAFRSALGEDVAGFERDWFGELGASPPPRIGPRPPEPGPLPPGWAGPRPNPSFDVLGSLPPLRPGAPRGGPGGDAAATFLVPSATILGVAVVAVLGVLGVRRARRMREAANDAAWNQLYARPIGPPPPPESSGRADGAGPARSADATEADDLPRSESR